jgi:hypothetical protein
LAVKQQAKTKTEQNRVLFKDAQKRTGLSLNPGLLMRHPVCYWAFWRKFKQDSRFQIQVSSVIDSAIGISTLGTLAVKATPQPSDLFAARRAAPPAKGQGMDSIRHPLPVVALASTVGGQVLPPWSTTSSRIPSMNDTAFNVGGNGCSGDGLVPERIHLPSSLPSWLDYSAPNVCLIRR